MLTSAPRLYAIAICVIRAALLIASIVFHVRDQQRRQGLA